MMNKKSRRLNTYSKDSIRLWKESPISMWDRIGIILRHKEGSGNKKRGTYIVKVIAITITLPVSPADMLYAP